MNFFDVNKSIIENLYLASGPIIAIFGLLIFYQIKLAKKSVELTENQIKETKNHLKIISSREAASLSAKQVKTFIEKYIKLKNEIYLKKVEINYPVFKGKINNFCSEEIKDWDQNFAKEFNEKLLLVEYKDLQLINYLEGFAMYFTKGIANEEIAFGSIGSSYCDYVEDSYPLISILRKTNDPHNPYENLIELYKLWRERLNKFQSNNELEEKQIEIKVQLDALSELKKKANSIIKPIKPIGT